MFINIYLHNLQQKLQFCFSLKQQAILILLRQALRLSLIILNFHFGILVNKNNLKLSTWHKKAQKMQNEQLRQSQIISKAQTPKKPSGFNVNFIEQRAKELKKQHEERNKKLQEEQQRKRQKKLSKSNSNHFTQPYNNYKKVLNSPTTNINQNSKTQKQSLSCIPDTKQQEAVNKKINSLFKNIPFEQQMQVTQVTADYMIKKGTIVKVIERTLTVDQFKVQCLYQNQIVQIIASKDQISNNNVFALLDYYQKTLGLR